MKSDAAIRHVICTWNWSGNVAASRVRRPRTMLCSTTSAMRPRRAPAMATPIRINPTDSSNHRVSIPSSSRDRRSVPRDISTIISRLPMWHPLRAHPLRGCYSSTRCIWGTLWPRAWMPNPTVCTLSKPCSRRAWRIWVSQLESHETWPRFRYHLFLVSSLFTYVLVVVVAEHFVIPFLLLRLIEFLS